MPISDYYEGEIEKDGITYHMVDSKKLTKLFEDHANEVTYGKKTSLTRAYIAKEGDIITTEHGSLVETEHKAKEGDVVFDNGDGDVYVPRDENGNSNGKQLLEQEYELQSGSLEDGDAVYMPVSKPSKILIGFNPDPISIRNPWGEGSSHELPAGSTLKLAGDKVTGIEKDAFEKTWSPTNENGEILPPAEEVVKQLKKVTGCDTWTYDKGLYKTAGIVLHVPDYYKKVEDALKGVLKKDDAFSARSFEAGHPDPDIKSVPKTILSVKPQDINYDELNRQYDEKQKGGTSIA